MLDSFFDRLNDLVYGFFGGVDGHVRLGIEQCAAFEQLLYFRQRIRSLEQRPVGLMLDALVDHFGWRSKANNEASFFDADQTASLRALDRPLSPRIHNLESRFGVPLGAINPYQLESSIALGSPSLRVGSSGRLGTLVFIVTA